MGAGEVICVAGGDRWRVGNAPEGFAIVDVSEAVGPASRALQAIAPEPLLAMARPVGLPRSTAIMAVDGQQALAQADAADLAGIHLPSPSIPPLGPGVGFSIL